MDIKTTIENLIKQVLEYLVLDIPDFIVEHPQDNRNGDYSSNVAMASYTFVQDKEKKAQNLLKRKQVQISFNHQDHLWNNPKELAIAIVEELNKKLPKEISKAEVAGPGFINFYLSREFFTKSVKEILKQKENFGKNDLLLGKKIIVEYTDPNPFKEFHIGHLMSNTVGESIARIVEWNGAEIKRACYQGDVGLHVAKAIWSVLKKESTEYDWDYLVTGKAYSFGNKMYETDESKKQEIININKKIYEKSDIDINFKYETGRQKSLDYFEKMYSKIGMEARGEAKKAFDFYFFESETGKFGKEIVEKNIGAIFEKSDGAIVFHGEKYDPKLHTRVFINKEGLPTYEAKELGLAKVKYEKYKYDQSIVITGNEINDYFKVLLMAMKEIFPELEKKTKHLSHGMLRLPSGKMSSRTGDVLTAFSIIDEVKNSILEKMKEREMEEEKKDEIAEQVAIGALKYSILKQSAGKDIIFDMDKSISFEGDSGPYLQYTAVRANSVLNKAREFDLENKKEIPEEISNLEKLLYQFEEVVKRSYFELESHHINTYLTELASAFNNFYGNTKILDEENKFAKYHLDLVRCFYQMMENGLWLLGIKTPEKM